MNNLDFLDNMKAINIFILITLILIEALILGWYMYEVYNDMVIKLMPGLVEKGLIAKHIEYYDCVSIISFFLVFSAIVKLIGELIKWRGENDRKKTLS